MWPLSLLAEPSTAIDTGTPASRIARIGAMPEASRMFEPGQCGDAGAGAREQRDAGRVELDAVRMPHIGADPAQLLRRTRPACS